MENIYLDLGNKIRFFRELKGLSQEALANQLGISQQAYQKIESGNTKLDFKRATKIAILLGVKLDFLMNFNHSNYLNNFTMSIENEQINNFMQNELIDSFKDQIECLKSEITFLRNQIKVQNN